MAALGATLPFSALPQRTGVGPISSGRSVPTAAVPASIISRQPKHSGVPDVEFNQHLCRKWDQRFESGFLQRGVRCELTNAALPVHDDIGLLLDRARMARSKATHAIDSTRPRATRVFSTTLQ
jgi:hypothetical protein